MRLENNLRTSGEKIVTRYNCTPVWVAGGCKRFPVAAAQLAITGLPAGPKNFGDSHRGGRAEACA